MGRWLGLAAAMCLAVSTCVLAAPLASAQTEVIETSVLDVATREPLGGAVVTVAEPAGQCITNAAGQCDLQVPQEGRVTITVSASGYVPQTVALTLPRSPNGETLTFALGQEKQQQPRVAQASYAEGIAEGPGSGDWVPISSDSVADATLSGETLPVLRGEGKIRISFSLPGLLRRDVEAGEGPGTILSIPNGLFSLEPGKPIIPAMTGKFVMPPGATILSITATVDETVELEDVEPALHIPVRVTPAGPVREDIVVEELTSTYPAEFYRVRDLGAQGDGNALGTVTIWPVQFDPATGSAVVHTTLELEVVYSVPGLVEEERSVSLLDDLPDRLAQVEVLPRGHRHGYEGQSLAADASFCESGTPRAFLVREDGRSEYSMISAGFWRDDHSAESSNFLGVMTYSDLEGSTFSQAKQVQHLSDYGEVELVTDYERVLELIQGEWAGSPGLVLFGQPGHVGGSLVPLASYLNWPLMGVFDDADLAPIQDLASDLGVSNVILSGELPSNLLTWLEGSDVRVIRLDGQREINQFFHLQKQNSGFYETVGDRDLAAYGTEILNTDWAAAFSASDLEDASLSSSSYYLVVVDQIDEGEFDVAAYQLAAYRSAEILEVGGYTAAQIRTEINAYDPTYVAIFGDGDPGEASCFFVTDPTGDTEDPDDIGTDFYYEVRESLSVGQLTDGWVVDSYVGRPIGSTDAETQQYVDSVKRYEAGCLDADYLDWTVSGSVTWDGGYEEAAVDVASYLGGVAPAATLLLEPSSPWYSQADDDFSKANYIEGTWGLDSGVTVGFAKGHGNDSMIALGSGGDPDILHRDHLAAHEDTWREYPFLQYVDSCMTARFMGADGAWDFDDDVNLGCGFIDAGAIAYIGTTMHAKVSYIDGINQEFFQHRITDWDYTLGQALAYARESWYEAQYYHSDWDKKTVLEMMLIGDPMIDLQLGSSEHPPSPPAAGTPSVPSPEDDATGVWIHSDLDWADAAHATGYDVYFGTTSDPPFVGTTLESNYELPALEYDTHYFWKVVAKNFCGEDTAGPTWDFFTTSCHTLNTSVSPGGSGSISANPAPNCGGGEYVHGTAVQLTADAASGYEFSHWSGSSSGSSNPTTISMDADEDVTGNFAPVCYGLDLAASPAGGGTVSADPAPNCGDKYIAGTEVELTANPSTGYSFGFWSGSASGSSNPTTITINADKSVTANFTQVCYTLSTAVSPAGGGTVDVSPLPNCTGGRYAAGTQVQLTSNPATAYSFSFWSGSASGSSNPTTITIDSDKSVTANFSQVCHSLNLSVDPSGGGTISADPAPNCGGGFYAEGTEVQLTASPYSGYSFGYWTGDLDGDINPRTITVDDDKSVTAHFVQQCYTLNTSVSPGGAGSVSANPAPNCAGGKYVAGTPVQLTANPASGYGFSYWSGSASGSANPTTITMNSDASVTANFAQICYDLAINVNPGGSGTVSPSPAPNCGGGNYTAGSVVQLTANAASGYQFNYWSGQASGTANPTTVTMNADKSVTANFTEQPCYSLTLSVIPGGGGTIVADPAPNCDGGKYLQDTVVELTATPLGGYSFSSWSGDASGSENPTTVTMNADQSVTASFSLVCYTLSTSVSPGGAGTVSVSPEPNCPAGAYAQGTQVQLTASAADGYNFSHWSGNASGSSNPLTFTMDSNKGITANFAATCFTLDTSVIPEGTGTITADPAPNCAGDKYAAGTVVELTAHGSDGYFFNQWSGDATGKDNPTTVVMDEDKSVFTILMYVGAVAEFPFYDGFESGSLAPVWTVREVDEGRVRVDSAYYPFQGTYHLLLDDEVSGSLYSMAKAILTIDLTGQTDLLLDFWWREYDDEGHLDDGVYISDDLGANWHEVESFLDYQPYWDQELIDIDALASSLGLSLNDHFMIKFQFWGQNPIPDDGFGIDEVKVRPANSPPLLSWTGEPDYEQDGLHPESGDTGDEYVYRIQYSDPFDGDAPAHVYLHIEKGGVAIGGSPFDMACESGDYQAGVICSYTKSGFAEAGTDYTYYFTAEDSRGATSAPTAELDAPDMSPNNPPSLEWTGESGYEEDGLHPESGHIGMDYAYRVKYSDPDGDEPGVVEAHIKKGGVEIPGSPFSVYCPSGDYTAGVFCVHLHMGFSESGSDYTYYFTAQDEHGASAIPTTEFDAPDLVGGDTKWTVLVYLNGDNDMEGEAIDDFLEMASVGSTDDVNIVVWFDRIPGYDDRYGDWSDFYRFFVTEGMTPVPENGIYTGEPYMGSYWNLSDFVNPGWERYNFPAEHYAVIIWDHGNSSRFVPEENTLFGDICFDESQYNDSSESGISMPELRLALDDGTQQGADPLDLLGFDASLMGSIEIDDQLIPYAHLRVGSQEEQPSGGWPYDSILAALVADPTMTPSEFAQAIVEAYYNEHAHDFPQSAVDLQAAYTDLNVAVDGFAAALIDGINSHHAEIVTARGNTQEFSEADYVDLYDFAYQIGLYVNDAAIDAAASAVMDAVDGAVVAEGHGGSWPDAHGISIYFPASQTDYNATYDGDQAWLEFTANTQWDEWLHAFYQGPVGDIFEPDDSPVEATIIDSGAPQTHSIVPVGDEDWVTFTLDAESEVIIETSGPSGDTLLWLYNSSEELIEYDDDDGVGLFSRIDRLCGQDSLGPGTYYVKVDEYGDNNDIESYDLTITIDPDCQFYVYVPMVVRAYRPPQWTTIMSEDFEGGFPGVEWEVSDQYSGDEKEYYWAADDFLPYRGDWSAWPAAGGADAVDPDGSDYPTDCYSWMVYGPFDLSDASEAEVSFHYWNHSELTDDYLFHGAAIDGIHFWGNKISGNSGGWQHRSFDLTDVPNLGDLTGQSQVWIAFVFCSDSDTNVFQGPFLDDVTLRKAVSIVGAPSSLTAEGVSSALPDTLLIETGAMELRYPEGIWKASDGTPTPTATCTCTPTPTPSMLPTPTITTTVVITPTATACPTPVSTMTPTPTITATATVTVESTPTVETDSVPADALPPEPSPCPTPEGT